MGIFSKLIDRLRRLEHIHARSQKIQEALGRIEARQLAGSNLTSLHEAEFRVFSQWGEDGIIQRLLQQVEINKQVFVEFGVQDYLESNTRFLLMHNNWSGLVMDGNSHNVELIRKEEIYWQYNIKADCAFITRENINDLLHRNGLEGDIGLLSIDLDGNDYWVWEAIDVIHPRIVIVEYNARFGADQKVTVPYDPDFVRNKAHYSMIYYGASLAALESLGKRKGYALVGCNSSGNNSFFVRRDCLPSTLPGLSSRKAYVPHAFREARDQEGKLQFLSMDQERQLLTTLPVVEIKD